MSQKFHFKLRYCQRKLNTFSYTSKHKPKLNHLKEMACVLSLIESKQMVLSYHIVNSTSGAETF